MKPAVSGHKNTQRSAPASPLVRPAQPMLLRFGLSVAITQASSVVTPESAEHGDYADTGYEWDETPMTLRETLTEVRQLGYFENLQPAGNQSLYGTDEDTDYRTGETTTYCLHIDGPPRAMRRLAAILKGKRHG